MGFFDFLKKKELKQIQELKNAGIHFISKAEKIEYPLLNYGESIDFLVMMEEWHNDKLPLCIRWDDIRKDNSKIYHLQVSDL